MSAGLPPLRPADAGYSDRTVTYPKLRSLPSVRFYKSYDSSLASSGQPEPTRQPSTIGGGFAFLLAVRQRRVHEWPSGEEGNERSEING